MASVNRKAVTSSKAKTVIISLAAAVVLIGGVLLYLAVKANEDNKIAALRYNFNKFFPETFDTVIDLDSAADYDNDGITNGEEKNAKSRMLSADSDSDGLCDADEMKLGTSLMTSDSDGDGIPDGVEVKAGLDPLSLITDDHTPDADRSFTRGIPFPEGNVLVSGGANIYGATLDKLSLNSVAANAGALTAPYEFHCEDEFTGASITFSFDTALISTGSISADSLKIYKFDPYLKQYDPIGGTVDTENGTVSCELETNGVYVLGAENVIHKAAEAYQSETVNIHLLIDNSGSMYPKSVQSTSKENDVNFKRLAFAKNFVTALGNNFKFAISVFTYEYKNLCGFSADKSHVLPAISSIRTLGAGFDGTSVERALMFGLESFGEETLAERNIIILLTDGISTDTDGYTIKDIVSLAKSKNVTVMTIGLGDEVDTELLHKIAASTGGSYYPISEANVLEGLYSTVISSMEDDIVDDDYDGTPDSYTLYDTGFDPDFNGFSFQNMKSKTHSTLDFGMVTLARDWFRNSVRHSADNGTMSYNFEGSTINTEEPLRKVILQLMQEQWTRPDTYLNFLSPGKTLKVMTDDARASQEKGWSKFLIPYSDAGTDWEEAEILVPNHELSTIRTAYSENDYQMLRVIHYYESFRGTGENFSLNSESDFNKVKSILATGTPIVTRILWENDDGTCSERYVLMTTLRRDLEDPNIFKIKVYDVNSRFISTIIVNRTIRVNGTSGNDFTYTANWDNKQASLTCWLTDVR